MVASLQERRQKALEHIGRYRLTLREVVSALFLEGKDPSNFLRRLKEEGLIVSHNRRVGTGLEGGWSYYQLTREGARQAGVPASRSKPLDNRVPQYLSFLAFCCQEKVRRELMEPEHFKRCFPESPDVNKEFYAVEKTSKGPLFYRLIYVGYSNASHYIKRLSKALEKAQGVPELSVLLSNGFFHPILLLSEQGQADQFRDLIRKSSLIPKRHRKFLKIHVLHAKTL